MLYTPLLQGWARRAGVNQSGVDDLVQDVFLKIAREMPRFEYDAAKKNFRGWLKTITIHAALDLQRQKAIFCLSESALAEVMDNATLEELWDAEYKQQIVAHALRVMKTDFEPKTWKACWETTVQGRAASDVGRELGMSQAAVFMAKSRVLKRLREELREMLE